MQRPKKSDIHGNEFNVGFLLVAELASEETFNTLVKEEEEDKLKSEAAKAKKSKKTVEAKRRPEPVAAPSRAAAFSQV